MFECSVRVLRSGFCKTNGPDSNTANLSGRSVVSGDLAPGDVYEISDPSLAQVPADSLLLAGDCIMNESMLTGTRIQSVNDHN